MKDYKKYIIKEYIEGSVSTNWWGMSMSKEELSRTRKIALSLVNQCTMT